MLAALGRSRKLPSLKGSDPALPPILQGKAIREFIPDKMISGAMPIPFRLPNGVKASGYRAELLPELCDVYLAARSAEKLPSNQQPIARAAEIIVRGLAAVGITALVDEATGYQETRAKDALAKILEAYVAEELQQWVSTFPVDYYKEMFRLRGIDFNPESVKRPPYFGHLTNDAVYKRIAPGVFEAIKEEQRKDAKKKRAKMHQQLTRDVGHPQLREHLSSVTTIMKLSNDWGDFKEKLDRIHPIVDTSMPPTLWDDEPDTGTGL